MKNLKKKPMYRYLMILTICSAAGLQGWLTLFNNFAVEVAGLEGIHIGVIQSVREIPGFLALLAIFVMLFIKEHRLSALSTLVLGVGLAATGLFPSFIGLLITTLIMSFGFHYYETTNQSLTRSLEHWYWCFHLSHGSFAELHPNISAGWGSHCRHELLGACSRPN
jgi:hypothetical protein